MKKIANPIIDFLKQNGFNALLVGSVSKNIALKTSDIDIWVIDEKGDKIDKLKEICKVKEWNFVKKMKRSDIAIYKFDASIEDNNKTKIEICYHHQFWDNNTNYDHFKTKKYSDDLLDCLYCMNKLYRMQNRQKKKIINVYDYYDFPLQKMIPCPFDVKIKKN